jgi:hypothetical protein
LAARKKLGLKSMGTSDLENSEHCALLLIRSEEKEMRSRLFGFGAMVASTLALGALAVPTAAQGPAKYTPPRDAFGHPDLQGVYNVATITPIERPAEMGGRRTMTGAEAAALEQAEARHDEQQYRPDVPADQRTAPPVGGLERNPNATYLERVFEGGGGVVGGYNQFWIAPGSKVLDINGEKRTSIIIDPSDGRIPPLRPDAERRNQEYLRRAVSPDAGEGAQAGPASLFDDPEQRPLGERCLLGFGSTGGPPVLPNYWYNQLKQIVQTKDHVLIMVEMVHDARVVRMNQPHLPSTVRNWMGDSVGRWEGDTLVVETTNFTGKTQFRGSRENLKVTERFTRTGPGTILYRFTVEDPTSWDRPWTGEYTWNRSDEQIFEYACHEGNYALTNVLRGARASEREGRQPGNDAPLPQR